MADITCPIVLLGLDVNGYCVVGIHGDVKQRMCGIRGLVAVVVARKGEG